MIAAICNSSIAVAALALALHAGSALAGERVDLFDQKGRRTGYAIVDREGGCVDYFDAQSRRLGWGQLSPSGKAEQFSRGPAPSPRGSSGRREPRLCLRLADAE